ncbi:MAG TPA: DUF3037 domain-containing protein [Polyangiaceae bacterium]
MASTKGFYSVVQFCPDRDRGEFANVGVVLVVPALGFLDVRFSEDNEGPKQRFTRDAFDDARLMVAKKAIQGRLRHEGQSWKTPEDLQAFAAKEGNQLLLSTPKAILAESPQDDLEELYMSLVYVKPKHQRHDYKPKLRDIFEPSLTGVPLKKNIRIDVPDIGPLRIAYAYKNGLLNLVHPEGFPKDPNAKVNDLAVKGNLIAKHPNHDGERMKLIVVGGFDPEVTTDDRTRASNILREHNTRLVLEEEVPAFIEEVKKEAHT